MEHDRRIIELYMFNYEPVTTIQRECPIFGLIHAAGAIEMKRSVIILLAGVMAGSLSAVAVNITISDGLGSAGLGVGGEDNETEPGTIHSDAWDLEAFGYTAATKQLDLIGTFDFKNGEFGDGQQITSGAIFIGTGSSLPGANNWSYAYVLNFSLHAYTLYSNFTINNGSVPGFISGSAPWSINTSTAHVMAFGSFSYLTGLSNPDGFGLQTYVSGVTHNEIELNLSALPTTVLNDFYTHFTMSCGNDDIDGHYSNAPQNNSVPDYGSTILLTGLGLGIVALARRRLGMLQAS